METRPEWLKSLTRNMKDQIGKEVVRRFVITWPVKFDWIIQWKRHIHHPLYQPLRGYTFDSALPLGYLPMLISILGEGLWQCPSNFKSIQSTNKEKIWMDNKNCNKITMYMHICAMKRDTTYKNLVRGSRLLSAWPRRWNDDQSRVYFHKINAKFVF